MAAYPQVKENYTGTIREVALGVGDKAIKIGGEEVLPFHLFEGNVGHRPKLALEVLDEAPEDWAEEVTGHYRDVFASPVAWAKKCVEDGAEMICLRLVSTDPTGSNKDVSQAARTAKEVAEAIGVPLIVYGTGSIEKDSELLKKVAESCSEQNLLLGAAEEANYQSVVAAALGYKHSVIAFTPTDVNLGKQLNLLIGNMGLGMEKIVMDITCAALGYGLEYSYTVSERDRLAALMQGDHQLGLPFISPVGIECWKVKEAKATQAEIPEWGDEKKRGILWESITALSMLLSGTDVLILRHPNSLNLMNWTLDELLNSDSSRPSYLEGLPKKEEVLPRVALTPGAQEIPTSAEIVALTKKVEELTEIVSKGLTPITIKFVVGSQQDVVVEYNKNQVQTIKEEIEKLKAELSGMEQL